MNVDEILRALNDSQIDYLLSQLKAAEERKRDAAYDPRQRWLHLQQTITWAEANLPPHLRWNRPRRPAAEQKP
jgi:hypothetical protein